MSELEYTKLIDASSPETPTSVTLPIEKQASEVIEMVMGASDDLLYGSDIFGRMSNGFDPSDFDVLPRDRIYDTPNQSEGAAGDELDLLAGEVAAMFQPAPQEQFPIFKQALRDFQAESKPKVARVDTPASYGEFVCEKAVEELDRRMAALEEMLHAHIDDDDAHHAHRYYDALEEHIDDPFAHKSRLVRDLDSDDVMGAAMAVSDLRHATTADEALDAMPEVPVDLPLFAVGKVKCWKDGDFVICSMKFALPTGEPRIATMAAKPRIDADAAEAWAERSGVDPVTLLGVLPDLADVACGKRLVRDTARVAMKAGKRDDVVGSADPVLVVSREEVVNPALAAMMHVHQRALAGDRQAAIETAKIKAAAKTPAGRAIAAPLVNEAQRRLGTSSTTPSENTFFGRYMLMGGCL